VIHDHHALLQFLQERFPHQTLLPADPLVRAQVRQVCEFFREEETNMTPDIIAVLNQKTAYLMGDEFSIVDLYAGSWLRDATAVVPTIVEQYKLRLQGRPAYKKADAA
jgi:glutathione S-transferase